MTIFNVNAIAFESLGCCWHFVSGHRSVGHKQRSPAENGRRSQRLDHLDHLRHLVYQHHHFIVRHSARRHVHVGADEQTVTLEHNAIVHRLKTRTDRYVQTATHFFTCKLDTLNNFTKKNRKQKQRISYDLSLVLPLASRDGAPETQITRRTVGRILTASRATVAETCLDVAHVRSPFLHLVCPMFRSCLHPKLE